MEPDSDVRRWLARLIEKNTPAECVDVLAELDDPSSFNTIDQADILILDYNLLIAFDRQWLARFKSTHPGLGIILMDYDCGPNHRRMAARLGADGVVDKEQVVEGLLEYERSVRGGVREDMGGHDPE